MISDSDRERQVAGIAAALDAREVADVLGEVELRKIAWLSRYLYDAGLRLAGQREALPDRHDGGLYGEESWEPDAGQREDAPQDRVAAYKVELREALFAKFGTDTDQAYPAPEVLRLIEDPTPSEGGEA